MAKNRATRRAKENVRGFDKVAGPITKVVGPITKTKPGRLRKVAVGAHAEVKTGRVQSIPSQAFAPVSQRAIIQRINRKLAQKGERVKTTRGNRWRGTLGDFYIVNPNYNVISRMGVDLESLGRELGVLAGWEFVAADDEEADD
jgi:hypothetical protein